MIWLGMETTLSLLAIFSILIVVSVIMLIAMLQPAKGAVIAAQWWLGGAGRRFRDAPCRFDAVLLDALDPARVTWLPGAFDAG